MNHEELFKLPAAERLQLVEALWDSLAAEAENLPVPAWHLEELNQRLDAFESGAMGEGEPWEKVREQLFRRWRPAS